MSSQNQNSLNKLIPDASQSVGEIPVQKRISICGKTLHLNQTRRNFYISASLLCGDILTFSLAYWLAYQLRFFTLPYPPAIIDPSYYLKIFLIFLPVWAVIIWAYRLYSPRVLFGGVEEYAQVFNAVTLGSGSILIVDFFLVRQDGISRGWFLLFWSLAVILTELYRFGMRRLVYFIHSRGHLLIQAVIVNADAEGLALYQNLKLWHKSGLRVMGFVDDRLSPGSGVVNGISVLGSLEDLEKIVRSMDIEEVIVATGSLKRDQLTEIYRTLASQPKVKLRFSSGLFEMFSTGLYIKEMANVPLIEVNKVRITGLHAVMKAVIDYCGAFFGLILLSPIYGLTALLIRLNSPGRVFYRHRVLGLNGRTFDAFKFRTMRENCDEIFNSDPELRAQFEENYKLKDDPRVTRVGWFLRRSSLDELPQLLNVLLGQMSIVGPRYITPLEAAKYGRWGTNLQTVKPGITGLWQVSGRSDVSYQERIRLDMYYIRNWSIWLDLHILYRTIPAVIQREGAY